MNKTILSLTLSTTIFLLCSCGDKEQAQTAGSFKQHIRSTFIETAAEKCVENAPQQNGLPKDKIRQVCACTADKLADSVSAEDLPDILAGNINSKLADKIAIVQQNFLDLMVECQIEHIYYLHEALPENSELPTYAQALKLDGHNPLFSKEP